MKLSSFIVDITDDNRLNPNVGINNYIFLEIVNNQPKPNQIMAAEEQQEQQEMQKQKKK